MKNVTLVLDNGTQIELAHHAFGTASFGVRWQGATSLAFFAGPFVLTLRLHTRQQVFESAALAGPAIERCSAAAPFALCLFLAYVAHKRDLPDRDNARRISEVAIFANPGPGVRPMTDEELRQNAAQAFKPHGSEFLQLAPPGKWNLARFLLHCGDRSWELQGQEAWFWGSFPTGQGVEQEEELKLQRAILSKLAALTFTPKTRSQLSIPLAASPHLEFAWWDWMALLAGPHKPLRALRLGGLGEFRGSVLETNVDPYNLALSVEHTRALKTVAYTLLLERERPYPRYLGRLLDVHLPLRLLPLVRRWGIERLLVQVEATGFYASVLDRVGGCIGAAWWEASHSTQERCPMNFPAAAWLLLHAILAAFWKDACSNVIEVGSKPSTMIRSTVEAKPARKKKKKRQGRLYLPPIRAVPLETITWAGRGDQERIERAVQTAHWYRLLPAGWEGRAGQADFQRRRALAIERARSALQPDPLPGFTFVHRPTEEERLAQAEGKPATPVLARGLLALSLVLQEEAIGIVFEEEQ